ncbi:DUF6318 family protein [Paenarthrobacter sp. NPDC089322]|uniref:DUF6318 family protein n=1 Tax=Paenarthrobacter sp. NPDC089322 TaxID=3155065 RepID=UPI003413DDA2
MSSLFAVPSPAGARAALLGFAVALLLCSCQAGSAPGPSPSPSQTGPTTASPASSATPSVSAYAGSGSTPAAVYKPADAKGKAENVPVPVMPELAKENSKEGLEAFIRYWFQLLSFAYETGDVSQAKALSSSACVLCNDLLSAVATNYTADRWLVGGQYRTPVIEVLWQDSESSQTAKAQVLQGEIIYMNADGTKGREPTPATNDAAAFFAVFRDGAWATTDVGVIR